MLRSKKAFLWSLIAIAFVGVLSLPVFGDEVANQSGSKETTAATTTATPGSAPEVNAFALPFLQDSENAFCPAEKPESAEPEWLVEARPRIRTCRCSCGYPCRTDADCGPGGICAAGITCC